MPAILNVSIIGSGQIGSRHLQALANLKQPARIQLVDPSQNSLDIACQRFNSVCEGDPNRVTLQTFKAIKDLDQHQDVTIVATDATVRSQIIKELIQKKITRTMILEKVLFQAEKEYLEIGSILKTKKIPTWVNCMLRATDFFKKFKTSLNGDTKIRMKVEGSNWGLACNSIHFLDLFSFLTGCRDFEFTDMKIDRIIPDFRRPDFKEITGKMLGANSLGHHLEMSCTQSDGEIGDKRSLKMIRIQNGAKHHELTVYVDKVIHKTITEKDETEVTEPLPLQSQITHLLVESIDRDGSCDLPTYNESMTLHLCLIKELLNKLTKISGKNVTRCPIT
jgi:predicted dehydrogenase